MKTGAVIFAFNNEQIDYVAMAAWSAKNIRRHLDIPVCLVTDTPDQDLTAFDQVVFTKSTADTTNSRYFSDYQTDVTWHNLNRMDAYALSPYDKTLVLDADYVVASDQLRVLLDSNQEFIAHGHAHDVTGHQAFAENNWFGTYKMPMHWATVMCFRKCQHAELIFDSMQMIRDHWQHYRKLYGIREKTYRNDFALSIAMNIVDGHTLSTPSIPWSLASVTQGPTLTQVDTDVYRLEYFTQDQKPRWILLTQDFHAMGKRALGDIIGSNS